MDIITFYRWVITDQPSKISEMKNGNCVIFVLPELFTSSLGSSFLLGSERSWSKLCKCSHVNSMFKILHTCLWRFCLSTGQLSKIAMFPSSSHTSMDLPSKLMSDRVNNICYILVQLDHNIRIDHLWILVSFHAVL